MSKVVWLDLDGCLVDLERGLKEKFNFEFPKDRTPENRKIIHDMWYEISKNHPNFWSELHPTPYYQKLYDAAREIHSQPIILSATPEPFTGLDHIQCEDEKTTWVKRVLGEDQAYRTIITKSKLKQDVMKYRPEAIHILVDDHPGNIERWIANGGIGIHHTDIDKTLNQLKAIK